MSRIDLNSKVDITTFDSIIDDIEQDLENKADKTIATSTRDGLMSSSDKVKLDEVSNSLISSEVFPSDDMDIDLPHIELSSEVFPGGGEININH